MRVAEPRLLEGRTSIRTRAAYVSSYPSIIKVSNNIVVKGYILQQIVWHPTGVCHVRNTNPTLPTVGVRISKNVASADNPLSNL